MATVDKAEKEYGKSRTILALFGADRMSSRSLMSKEKPQPIPSDVANLPGVREVFEKEYEIRFEMSQLWGKPALRVATYLDAKEAGHVTFALYEIAGTMQADSLHVFPSRRHQGIATAMYVCPEVMTGMRAVKHAVATPDGNAFWNQPGRPFGGLVGDDLCSMRFCAKQKNDPQQLNLVSAGAQNRPGMGASKPAI